jgi:hypothetical protein
MYRAYVDMLCLCMLHNLLLMNHKCSAKLEIGSAVNNQWCCIQTDCTLLIGQARFWFCFGFTVFPAMQLSL